MKLQEEKVRFHTKASVSLAEAGRQANVFLSWVRSILTADKYALFLLCFNFPTATSRIMEECFSKLKKVFDGGNSYVKLEFSNGEEPRDARLMSNVDRQFWQKDGYIAMAQHHNSFVVVDYENNANPYHYILPCANVVDFSIERDGTILDIVFEEGDDYVWITGDAYYRYSKDNLDDAKMSNPHDLGFCPVNWFWDDIYDIHNKQYRKSIIQEYIGDLDHLLMFLISEKCSDLYAIFPMYWAIVQECGYEDDNRVCDGGALKSKETGLYLINRDTESLQFCPKCKSKMIGVGTTLDVHLPNTKDEPFSLPPAGQIESNTSLLKHIVEKRDGYIKAIKEGLTGHKHDVEGSKAVNIEQVQSIIEGAKSKIMALKYKFERIDQWTLSTKLKIKYGASFLSAEVNYGTEFYLLNVDQLHTMYNKAIEIGADTMVLDSIKEQMYETKYRDSPNMLERALMIMDLDPYKHKSDESAYRAYEMGVIDKETLWLKLNLASNISRFEYENGNICFFAEKMEYSERIATIKNAMLEYMPKGTFYKQKQIQNDEK